MFEDWEISLPGCSPLRAAELRLYSLLDEACGLSEDSENLCMHREYDQMLESLSVVDEVFFQWAWAW